MGQADCQRIFGGPRDMRYVAEDNLVEEMEVLYSLYDYRFRT